MESGELDRVVAVRHDFQPRHGQRYSEAIEALTGPKVVAFHL